MKLNAMFVMSTLPEELQVDRPVIKLALRNVLRYVHRKTRPVHVGELLIDSGHSVENVLSFIEYLILDGKLRWLTLEEKLNLRLDPQFEMVTYTGGSSAVVAFD